jgi:hypothetical protein
MTSSLRTTWFRSTLGAVLLTLILVGGLVPASRASLSFAAAVGDLPVVPIAQRFAPPVAGDSGTYDCLAASTAMVLGYLQASGQLAGPPITYRAVLAAYRSQSPGSGPLSPYLAPGVVSSLTGGAVQATPETLADPGNWQGWLGDELGIGAPVIAIVPDWRLLSPSDHHTAEAGYSDSEVHAIVVSGLHNGLVAYEDPWDGQRWSLPVDEFAAAWGPLWGAVAFELASPRVITASAAPASAQTGAQAPGASPSANPGSGSAGNRPSPSPSSVPKPTARSGTPLPTTPSPTSVAPTSSSAPVPPAAPANLIATVVGQSDVRLAWQYSASDPDVFVLYDNRSLVTTISGNARTYDLGGLSGGSQHCLQLFARKGGVLSVGSTVACVAVPAAATPGPSATACATSTLHVPNGFGGSTEVGPVTICLTVDHTSVPEGDEVSLTATSSMSGGYHLDIVDITNEAGWNGQTPEARACFDTPELCRATALVEGGRISFPDDGYGGAQAYPVQDAIQTFQAVWSVDYSVSPDSSARSGTIQVTWH